MSTEGNIGMSAQVAELVAAVEESPKSDRLRAALARRKGEQA